jgi:hypothetical protein
MTYPLGTIRHTVVVNMGRSRKPVDQITDRAKRYRAQQNVKGPKRCVICGSTRNLDVMHLDGNESHGESRNLAWGCRSCNAKLGAAFKRIGKGVRTRQYNPASGAVPTFTQYSWAVSQQRHSGDAGDAGAIIHATPKVKRSEYAKRILAKRYSGRDEVPF